MADALPPLPKFVSAPAGRVQVLLAAEVVSERGTAPADDATEKATSTVMGMWYPTERRIRLRRDMPLDVQWLTLFHEQMHAWMFDTGCAHGMTEALHEQLCDVIGLARLLELREKRQ